MPTILADPLAGQHLFAGRAAWQHHGVGLGGGLVVHWDGTPGRWRDAQVAVTTLAEFLRGGALGVVAYSAGERLPPAVAAVRALAELGRIGYHPTRANCEHFARWAVTGQWVCVQLR